jgi:hypothetical protein
MLINLNSENKFPYSKNGKNLFNQYQIASLIQTGSFLFFKSMYFIIHHSKIGTSRKYNTKKITATIKTSTTYFDSKKCKIVSSAFSWFPHITTYV